MEKKLEVKNLQISFRTNNGLVKAVRNISFDLYKGETLAIVGESGSGKSVTSKAIIGISSGNAIVEGGEILYDGQDLLKISEEDFHKIRGDKIAMIFQDPLSSLSPIMRVGRQLTEAMLLKGKASQKNARTNFNFKLKKLNENLDLVNEDKENNKKQCKIFDDFCINSSHLELAYNNAHAAVVALEVDANDLIFLTEKNQKVNANALLKSLRKELRESFHPFVLVENDEVKALEAELDALIKNTKRTKEETLTTLNKLSTLANETLKKKEPNYFRLGYYLMKNPNSDISHYEIDELDKMTGDFLNQDYMFDFIKLGSTGIEKSHVDSINKKRALLPEIDKVIEYFNGENCELKESVNISKELGAKVRDAIDYLQVYKNSIEYSFELSILDAIHRYFNGLVDNPKAIKKYEIQSAKFDRMIKAGKTPTWKVIPPRTIDLDAAKQTIITILTSLKKCYESEIEACENFNKEEKMIALIDYLKEQASNVVYRVTYQIAKARALELLAEVGLPDPIARYNQYPFEFSGGMRQRVVIAIALSANPDILICDEPTTALDVTIQSQILELINKIKEERHLSVIFITHDLGVVANMADRIAVMYAGKIVEYGTSEDVFYDPRHPYTWALLSSMPDLDTKEKLEAIPGTPPNMIYPPKGDAFAERNKYALEIDFEEEPPLFEISETHYAATWLLHPNAPHIDPPKIVTERIKRMTAEVSKDE